MAFFTYTPTRNNQLSGFIIKVLTLIIVRIYRVLVHPREKPLQIVGHLQLVNFKAAIPHHNRSNNCCSSEFSDCFVCFIMHRLVSITLE